MVIPYPPAEIVILLLTSLAGFADVISDFTNWVEDTLPIVASQVEFDVLNLDSAPV